MVAASWLCGQVLWVIPSLLGSQGSLQKFIAVVEKQNKRQFACSLSVSISSSIKQRLIIIIIIIIPTPKFCWAVE